MDSRISQAIHLNCQVYKIIMIALYHLIDRHRHHAVLDDIPHHFISSTHSIACNNCTTSCVLRVCFKRFTPKVPVHNNDYY